MSPFAGSNVGVDGLEPTATVLNRVPVRGKMTDTLKFSAFETKSSPPDPSRTGDWGCPPTGIEPVTVSDGKEMTLTLLDPKLLTKAWPRLESTAGVWGWFPTEAF